MTTTLITLRFRNKGAVARAYQFLRDRSILSKTSYVNYSLTIHVPPTVEWSGLCQQMEQHGFNFTVAG